MGRQRAGTAARPRSRRHAGRRAALGLPITSALADLLELLDAWATLPASDRALLELLLDAPAIDVEVFAAYRWWREAGKPKVGDWVVTVGPDGQRIELP